MKRKILPITVSLALMASPLMAETGVPKNGLIENPYVSVQAGHTTKGDFNNRVFFGADVGKMSVSGFYSTNNLDNSDSFGIYDLTSNESKVKPFLRVTTSDGKYDDAFVGGKVDLESSIANCNLRLVINGSDIASSENICTKSWGNVSGNVVYSLTFEKGEKPSHYLETEINVPAYKNLSVFGRVEDILSPADRTGVVGLSYSF